MSNDTERKASAVRRPVGKGQITAAMLYALADALRPESFMCCEFSRLFDWSLRTESFEPLLEEHGVPLDGNLGMTPGKRESGEEYLHRTASIRFMFLEFLALDLETQ